MKKLLYFAMALGLVACQTEKVDVNGGLVDDEVKYLSINIATAPGTRAYNDESGYEDGWKNEAEESKVKQIRFYFFNDDDAAPVTVNGSSYADFSVPADGFGDNGQNMGESVEHKLAATVVLHKSVAPGQAVASFPKKVVAVLNPDVNALGTTNYSLTELKKAMVEGLAYATDAGSNYFVMTNSVYADGASNDAAEVMDAVEITEDNLQKTADLAKEKPVKIYVERVVAKVTLKVDETKLTKSDDYEGDGDAYDTGKTYGDDNKIFVKFTKWNVTATADKSYLVKNINPKWANAVSDIADANNLFKTEGEPWNFKDFYRSYWAYNPAGVKFQYGTFSGVNDPTHGATTTGSLKDVDEDVNPALAKDLGSYTYLPENAAANEGTTNAYPSQVIIGALLVDKNGEALNLCEFTGQKFVDDEDNTTLREAIASRLAIDKKYYTKNGETYSLLGPNDIKIVTAWEAGQASDEKNGRYFVYAQLADDDVELYTVEGEVTDGVLDGTATKVEDNKTVNTSLIAVGPAKVWTEGYTYYFFNIRHLASELNGNDASTPGFYGVVRNHVYNAKITKVEGLGTPVFDPDEIIIPEIPNEEEVYLAAEINILAWRIVDHDYELNW